MNIKNPIKAARELAQRFIDRYNQPAIYEFGASPVQAQEQPLPTPTPTPQGMLGGMTREQYNNAIQSGFQNWNQNLPAANYANNYYDLGLQYPQVFDKYPFLLPAITLAETAGGTKMKQSPKITNWGIYVPKEQWNPQSIDEVLERTASGISKRYPQYEPFRQSLDLEDLARVYAPVEDNPDTGGSVYANNLRSIMDVFHQKVR